ncbi:hypothetical protein [Brevibacterium sp. UCMA 11754]|uniref:hypothetical protein n=1 Tax=Brevibacterium sp. UCMA 11754 TaxID=2749198 RepID=UPI001F2538F6|nr:hypothetical protein [Brevibacterium sp. UCMA 11754]MCF2571553.1 hypothetical protein [Brevibacterium sp. UCMA 11754]
MVEHPLLPAWYDVAWSATRPRIPLFGCLVIGDAGSVESRWTHKVSVAVFIIVIPILGSLVWLDYRRKNLAQRKHSEESAQ